jgi:hypothetical protein
MILRVQCYAGRKADERPVKFRLGPFGFSSRLFGLSPIYGTSQLKAFRRSLDGF